MSENPTTGELFVLYADTGETAVRDKLVEAHLGLAAYLARRFANRGQPLDDLMQVASVGLLKAIERFDVTRGVAFSTFATTTIVGELKRHLRDRGWAVRAPRRMQELYASLGASVDILSQRLGRSPSVGELAQEVGASEEEVLEALEAGQAYRFASLDANPDAEQGGSGYDRLGTSERGYDTVEARMAVDAFLAKLPEVSRKIVVKRFFEGMTQSEIATELGISQMQVSRLLSRSVATMRAFVRSERNPDGPGGTGRPGGTGIGAS